MIKEDLDGNIYSLHYDAFYGVLRNSDMGISQAKEVTGAYLRWIENKVIEEIMLGAKS
jgi:hypothetical protein